MKIKKNHKWSRVIVGACNSHGNDTKRNHRFEHKSQSLTEMRRNDEAEGKTTETQRLSITTFFLLFVFSISLSAEWSWLDEADDEFAILYFLFISSIFLWDHDPPHNVHFGLFGFRAAPLYLTILLWVALVRAQALRNFFISYVCQICVRRL